MLDKASMLLSVVGDGPASAAGLAARTGISRPTVYRLVGAMERLGLLSRDVEGRFVLGPRLGTLVVEAHRDRLEAVAGPPLAELAALTGLDVRLFRRQGPVQICVAVADGSTVGATGAALGSAQPANTGPVAQVLLAWETPEEIYRGLRHARFNAGQLVEVRRRGWAYGPDDMSPGTRTVAAPVRVREGRVVAALAVSGAHARMSDSVGRMLSEAVIDSAVRIGDAVLHSCTKESAY
ncbi:helix-turn-helix domain-containing protein [Streptomyces sp. SCA3-4]|uniref:IclR family transcriptional regulator n=1 Tax=Streptomyces sichuanensis TaxID=2871810 RepID=UPI001CE2C63F|nr:IclR family transcriptional regulator C-terminal domain-containing protein [Streptomyces sichuanensis]MCA6094687.1 helix-turn-helix domain-containing protein [Streptomyces sichuanensis]